jgi:hypothetical protein
LEQLHNPVKHCGLSSRRSRVQIPAGAIPTQRYRVKVLEVMAKHVGNALIYFSLPDKFGQGLIFEYQ